MMEHKKVINLLDNTPKHPNIFWTKSWAEIYDVSCGTYNTNSQIKFKASMWRLLSCDYSETYILVSVTVAALAAGGGNINIKVVFNSCTTFTDWINEINITLTDNAEDIDGIMSMYNLIEYSDDYLKASGSLWQYYRHESALTNADALTNFTGKSASFKYKQKQVQQEMMIQKMFK